MKRWFRFLTTMLATLFVMISAMTPVMAATSTVSVETSGLLVNQTVTSTVNSAGKVVATVTKHTSDGLVIKFPAVPLKGVVKGNQAISYTTIRVEIYDTVKNRTVRSVVIPVTIVEYTKLTGVWPFQKRVKSGRFSVSRSMVTSDFFSFSKHFYPEMNLKFFYVGDAPSTQVTAPVNWSETYGESIGGAVTDSQYFTIVNKDYNANLFKSIYTYPQTRGLSFMFSNDKGSASGYSAKKTAVSTTITVSKFTGMVTLLEINLDSPRPDIRVQMKYNVPGGVGPLYYVCWDGLQWHAVPYSEGRGYIDETVSWSQPVSMVRIVWIAKGASGTITVTSLDTK